MILPPGMNMPHEWFNMIKPNTAHFLRLAVGVICPRYNGSDFHI